MEVIHSADSVDSAVDVAKAAAADAVILSGLSYSFAAAADANI